MSASLTSLQQQVLAYLQQNPCAAETAEGIQRMWLGCSGAPAALLEVERALQGLVVMGVLEECELPGGFNVFRAPAREA